MAATTPVARRRARRGFSLVELIVVIVILGVLAGLTVPLFRSGIVRTRDARTETELIAVGRYAAGVSAVTGLGFNEAAIAQTTPSTGRFTAADPPASTDVDTLEVGFVLLAGGREVGFVTRTASGRCVEVRLDSTGSLVDSTVNPTAGQPCVAEDIFAE